MHEQIKFMHRVNTLCMNILYMFAIESGPDDLVGVGGRYGRVCVCIVCYR